MNRIKLGESLPKVVSRMYEQQLLSTLGFRDHNDFLRYEIAEMQKVNVPFSTIKTLLEDDSANAYRIRVRDKKNSKIEESFLKNPLVILTSIIILDDYDPNKISKFKSLREYEDDLSKKKRRSINKLHRELAKKPIDENFIEKISSKLNLTSEKNIFLKNSFIRFKNVPGYQKILEEIISNFYCESRSIKSIAGKIFELNCALFLESERHERIIDFSFKLKSRFSEREFDLLTSSKIAVECKFEEKDINRGVIMQQLRTANENQLEFMVILGEKISDETKNWFIKSRITFIDNLNNF